MAIVTLVNRTKRPPRMLVLNLTKDVAPVKVVNRTTQESRDGQRRIKVIEKVVPQAIRIPAGGSLKLTGKNYGNPEAVMRCPEVAAAIAAREIRVDRSPVAQPKKPSGQGEASTEKKPKTRKRNGG